MFRRGSRRRWAAVTIAALAGLLAPSTSALAAQDRFFEETASAFWAVPFECADGSTVQGTLLVLSTRDFESPDTEDPEPTARIQFQAVCPDGSSFSWAAPSAQATITSTPNLKSVTVTGPGSKRVQRAATATGTVTFDGEVLVDGPSNHPTRPAPFIRVDTEK